MSPDIFSKKHNGYTLLEVMMAVLIFGIVATSLFLPFVNSINLSSRDQDIVNCNNLTKLYMKNLEAQWKLANDFDTGSYPAENDSAYTYNGKYKFKPTSQDIAFNSAGKLIVRRMKLVFYDKNNNVILETFLDFNRP
jgi:prepilin-type N-terminal cleavage/methylation domain-containing protein